MQSIKLRSHVGQDGILNLRVPVGVTETDVEVVVVVQNLPSATSVSTPESPGWPADFFEKTFGCLKDDPLVRGEQGEYESREELS